MIPHPRTPVPTESLFLQGMTSETKPAKKAPLAIPTARAELTLAQQGLLDFVARANPTQDEIRASCGDAKYSSMNRLTELKKMKLVVHKQEVIKGRGSHFGESRYLLTELGARLAVPAGTGA